MKGLLTKDFLTVKKKYGIARLIMDLAIIAALMIILEGAGSIYITVTKGIKLPGNRTVIRKLSFVCGNFRP